MDYSQYLSAFTGGSKTAAPGVLASSADSGHVNFGAATPTMLIVAAVGIVLVLVLVLRR